MSNANDEKWDLKRSTWPQTWSRMTGCVVMYPSISWHYSHGPYWIVLFSSLWRAPPPLLFIDTVLKVWSRCWQQLRESQQQAVSVFSLRETTVFRTFEFLWDDIDLVGGPVNPHKISYSASMINPKWRVCECEKALVKRRYCVYAKSRKTKAF